LRTAPFNPNAPGGILRAEVPGSKQDEAMMRGWRTKVVAVAGALWLAIAAGTALAAAPAARVALVIGNGAYQRVPKLPNPANDARAMAEALKGIGFTVIEGYDLTIEAMLDRIHDFGQAADGADVALVFYAGHGLQLAGQNYLLPVDARLLRETDVRREAVEVEEILGEARQARRLRVVILDACRDNPFQAQMARSLGTRSAIVGRGFARIDDVEADTLIAFATKADAIAEDGTGNHSPYTAALLQHLATPGLSLERFFGKVRDSVVEATGGRQQPFVYGSLGGDPIYLAQPAARTPATPEAGGTEAAGAKAADATELAFWDAIKTSANPADYQAYLETYPHGRFAALAQVRARPRTATADDGASSNGRMIAPPPAPPSPAPPAAAVPVAPVAPATPVTARPTDTPGSGAGAGAAQDEAAAARLARLAADQGDAAGQAAMAERLAAGHGVPRNEAEAARYARLAADQGNAAGEALLGRLFEDGRGVARDEAEAARWYRLAADRGNADAQTALAKMLESGRGVERDERDAVRLYRQAADQGRAEAQNGLGSMLEDGRGAAKNEAEAARWYRLAAEQGLAEAQYNLGVALENGRGVDRNLTEAARFYRQAADQGHADAQVTLGLLLESGRGVARDETEAARLYRLAADQGNPLGQAYLAVLLEHGRGVTRDEAGAVRLYGLAAAQGNALARAALQRLTTVTP
jgi:TPR repeat protein